MSSIITVDDSLDPKKLEAMRVVALMKEAADKQGVGFIGGFVAPDGKKFVMTNMDDDDVKMLMPDELQ
jgi:hypothetical protein